MDRAGAGPDAARRRVGLEPRSASPHMNRMKTVPEGGMERSQSLVLSGLSQAEQERIVRGGFMSKLRRLGRRLPFAREALASYFAMIDPRVPALTRAAVVAPLAYFVIPTDLIPDFILGLGFTDDALVFWTAWKAFRRKITEGHYARADAVLLREERS